MPEGSILIPKTPMTRNRKNAIRCPYSTEKEKCISRPNPFLNPQCLETSPPRNASFLWAKKLKRKHQTTPRNALIQKHHRDSKPKTY